MPQRKLKKRAIVIALQALGLSGSGMLALGAAPAIAQSITWNGTQSADWQDAQNWSSASLPGSTGYLFINSVTPNAPVIDNSNAQAGVVFLGAIGGPSLTVQNGGQLTSDTAIISNSTNGFTPGTSELQSGTATINGAGSQWTANAFNVGFYGTGTFNVTGGGKAIATTTFSLGSHVGSFGTLSITGAGSAVQSGQFTVSDNGASVVTISDRGTAQVSGLLMANSAGSTSTVEIIGAGASLQASGSITVGSRGTGTLDIKGGATASAGSRTYVGMYAGGEGKLLVSGAGTQFSSLTDFISLGLNTGSKGQLTATDGALVDAYQIVAGFNAGSEGTLVADGPQTRLRTSSAFLVGYQGTGAATLSNGATLETANRVRIADAAGSVGTLNIGAAASDAAAAPGVVQAALGVRFGNGTGKLVFNHSSSSYVFAPGISSLTPGMGTIDMLAGSTTLTGDSSGFSGQTNLLGGALTVNGALGGTLNVASGASLRGSGTVGTTTLQNGATLAPGAAGTTLNVAGDLTFSPGSVYQVRADSQSSASSRVVVSGTANLAGSAVHVGPDGGFQTRREYAILSAGTVNGQFNSVSSNYAFLDPALRYDGQNVLMQLGRKQVPVTPETPETPVTPVTPVTPSVPETPTRPIAFADAAQTGNQRAVANALDSLPAGNPLHEYILTLPEGATAAAFNSLSGEAHASVTSTLTGLNNSVRAVPLAYLRANLGAGMRAGAPTAQLGGTPSASALPSSNAQPAWAEVIGNWQTWKGNGDSAQVRQNTGGVFAGVDHALGGGWRLGGALGFTDSKIRVDDRSSQADIAGYSAAVFGGKVFEVGPGKLNVMAGTAYTWHDISTERRASVSGVSQTLTADYGASTTQLFAELGYALPMSERVSIEPFAGLSWSDTRNRSFSESGGSAALNGQSDSNKQTTSTLGLRGLMNFTVGQTEGRVQATLGWRHAFGDVQPESTMSFDGGQAFTVAGAPIARDAALAELGVETALTRNATIGLNYTGQFGGGNRENAGSVHMTWRY
ncbi:autotransporter outer membrane beta-barrel domain-containing protein [Achromobacter mucicolens]|uniref:autotransporter family protein n=1 Tax=Achromobacter mucicolens TaxID=1389922 RepID=UPI001CC02174|nr:autotransporter outer membrane beta-barrel domain-containing protein [Achromobacter mucicolens]UAN02131.1 autotransporter domain-containing protein [Achromobacter mucicolens]